MLELLCVERGVPILGGTLPGNASDKRSNNRLLEKISALLARHGLGPGAFVSMADSSLVTPDNLAKLATTPFVSRLPFTYAESERVVHAAVRDDRWVPLGAVTETPPSASRPAALYRATEEEVTLYGTSYRAVVVHSSAYDKRRQKKLEKRLVRSRETVEKKLTTIAGRYYCLADAQEAARRASE